MVMNLCESEKKASHSSLHRIVVGNDVVLKNVMDSGQGGNVQEHAVNAMNEIDGQHKRLRDSSSDMDSM